MNQLINKVQLIGHIGSDPNISEIKGGSKKVYFRLACKEVYKSDKGEKREQTYWFNIVGWNKAADYANRYLRKGSKLALSGKLVSRDYEDKNGVRRYTVEVVMDDMMMLHEKSS